MLSLAWLQKTVAIYVNDGVRAKSIMLIQLYATWNFHRNFTFHLIDLYLLSHLMKSHCCPLSLLIEAALLVKCGFSHRYKSAERNRWSFNRMKSHRSEFCDVFKMLFNFEPLKSLFVLTTINYQFHSTSFGFNLTINLIRGQIAIFRHVNCFEFSFSLINQKQWKFYSSSKIAQSLIATEWKFSAKFETFNHPAQRESTLLMREIFKMSRWK